MGSQRARFGGRPERESVSPNDTGIKKGMISWCVYTAMEKSANGEEGSNKKIKQEERWS